MSTASQYYNSIKEERDEWKSKMPQKCMWCGSKGDWRGLEVHEIERRSAAPRSWGRTCNYLLLDGSCHATVFAAMDKAWQLRVKMDKDAEHYSLDCFLRIADPTLRAPNRITQEEVNAVALDYPIGKGIRFSDAATLKW